MFILPHLKGLLSGNLGSAAFKSAGLDLKFAANKSLVDSISGNSLVTFTRADAVANSATYVGSDGLVKTATINEPRFDHNPTTGESLGLMVEEARTNYLLQSQDFTTASWSQTGLTITPNTTTSPDGSANADTLLTTVAGSALGQTALSLTAGSTITVSIFAKKITSNFIRFELGNLCSCWFNLDTGVTASNNAGSGNVLFSAKSIQPFGNGWYRCVLTATTSVITTLSVNIFATNTDGNTSSIGSSIFLWGAVAEAGAPTSYIPTTTATVTRAADVASITGSNFSSWYNQTEGTMFADALNTAVIGTTRIFSVSNNANANRIHINRGSVSGGNIGVVVTTSSVAQVGLTLATSLAALTSNKSAFAYKTNDFAGSVNGLTPVTQNTGSIPTVSQATIGNGDTVGLNTMTGTIKRVTYWPTRLADTTLQQITQP